jgi:hypothetical protein
MAKGERNEAASVLKNDCAADGVSNPRQHKTLERGKGMESVFVRVSTSDTRGSFIVHFFFIFAHQFIYVFFYYNGFLHILQVI